MDVYKDDFESLSDLKLELGKAKSKIIEYKTKAFVAFPNLGKIEKILDDKWKDKIKRIYGKELSAYLDNLLDINNFNFLNKTKDEEKQEEEERLQKEIEDKKQEKIDAEYTPSEKYGEYRREEYPSIADQLDILYHKGVSGFVEEIKKIKDKYPKP